jgi:colanic acid/amylovoran biosynthesis protein
MSVNILIINVHSSRNAGDAALTQVTLEQLQSQFPQCRITLAMDDPGSYTGEGTALCSLFGLMRDGDRWRPESLLRLIPATLTPVLSHRWWGKAIFALTPRDWRTLLRAYLGADLIVSKPGGFLYSSGRGVALFISLYTLALGWLAGKPVYLLPQSVGPFARRWERWLVGLVLDRLRKVIVREPISLSQLEICGVRAARCHLLPDMAFAFKGAPEAAAQQWLYDHRFEPDSGSPLLGMTVINYGAQNRRFLEQARYEAACAEAVRFFVEQIGGRVIIFPQVWGPSPSQDDRVPARRIAQQLADLGQALMVIETPLPPDLLKAVYGKMDLFVGTRMHSNIFALSQRVPAIAIGYQHKTQGILQMLGLERWSISIENLTGRVLQEKLAALWREREAVRAHLDRILPALIAQAQSVGALVAKDFYG